MSSITVYKGFLNFKLLEQYDVSTGLATGIYKPNLVGDPDYVEPIESDTCPIKRTRWIGREQTAYCEEIPFLWSNVFIRFSNTIETFNS